MRTFSVVIAAAVLVGSSAFAADLPSRTYSPSPISPQPISTWTGFYVGANAGYGWGSVSNLSASSDMAGFVGGAQLGYNWQAGNLVVGIESDFQGSAQSRSDTVTIGGVGLTVDQNLPWFATLRGRIGYSNGPWLLYATGGAAWVDYKISGTALGTTVNSDTTKAAWTLGGGFEWMFMPQWSAKIEYLYIDTGDVSTTIFGVPITGRAKDNIVRVGANYHF